MIFSKPEIGSIPGSTPKITFKRIRVGTVNPDNTTGDLILGTPEMLFSFGLQENRDMTSGKVNGYMVPLCLWDKNGVKPEEKTFTDTFNAIVEKCKSHLIEHKEDIERYDLEMNDLKNFNPLYWKRDKGKIVEGKGPMLYVKCLMGKKNEKINTIFINDETNEEMDPFEFMSKYCYMTCAIKIESIFIGNKISLQLKLYEAVVRIVDTGMKGLLRSRANKPVITIQTSENLLDNLTQSNRYDTGSIDGSDSEEEEEDDDVPPVENKIPVQIIPEPIVDAKKKVSAVRGGRGGKTTVKA
jgi:hypothetical protein